MKSVAIHQSQYIPWAPYFAKIASADLFVVMDNVQYQKNGVQNRNKMRNKQGDFWLTVPVSGELSDHIIDKKIHGEQWKEKHWKSIYSAYKKAPYWQEYENDIENIYKGNYETLFQINQTFLLYLLRRLEIQTPIIRMSELQVTGNKSELVLNICKSVQATEYISGSGGRVYMDLDSFKRENIQVTFKEGVIPRYHQSNGEFIEGLSILDMLFNVEINEIINFLKK